jgi:hypothetical protein
MTDPILLVYDSKDGDLRLTAPVGEDTVWLTQAQMAELFQRDQSVVARHIQNIQAEGELDLATNMQKMHIAGADKLVSFYNLDVIISVGYRVKSQRGTQFRIWATKQLRDYIVKGFTLNDDRFKQAGTDRYFEELLERIRDIRSSEKVFWKKVLEIYATSTDYDSRAEATQHFFATVQNKMHWAAHGHTAAEIVADRAKASKPNVGMTNFPGKRPLKADAEVAKNYLSPNELDVLNRIVTMYLDFAELQALERRPMTMANWIEKLDGFLKISDRGILDHLGSISSADAKAIAHGEYEKWRKEQAERESAVEGDFKKAIESAKRIEKSRKKHGKKEN